MNGNPRILNRNNIWSLFFTHRAHQHTLRIFDPTPSQRKFLTLFFAWCITFYVFHTKNHHVFACLRGEKECSFSILSNKFVFLRERVVLGPTIKRHLIYLRWSVSSSWYPQHTHINSLGSHKLQKFYFSIDISVVLKRLSNTYGAPNVVSNMLSTVLETFVLNC